MQPRHVTSFQDAILEGRWADSLELLPSLASDADTLKQVTPAPLAAVAGNSVCDTPCALQARFWILRQKYVEALEQENVPLALHTLRVELAPLQVNTPEVRMLAGAALSRKWGLHHREEQAFRGCVDTHSSSRLLAQGPYQPVLSTPQAASVLVSVTGKLCCRPAAAVTRQQGAGGRGLVASAAHHPADAGRLPAAPAAAQPHGAGRPPGAALGAGTRRTGVWTGRPHLCSSPVSSCHLLLCVALHGDIWTAAAHVPRDSLARPGSQAQLRMCTQIQACPYYNVPPTSLSLLSNYQAGMEQLPTQPAQVSQPLLLLVQPDTALC